MTSTTTTAADLDADRTRIVTRLAEVQEKIAAYTADAEALKAELRQLPAGDYAVDGRPAVRIIPTRRFDATAAAGLLSTEQRESALVVTYDAAKVKQHLTPTEVEEFMVEAGKPKVVLL